MICEQKLTDQTSHRIFSSAHYNMSMDNYQQFQSTGQGENTPGQAAPQNGGAPGQQNEQAGGPSQMQFSGQDGQGLASPAPGSDGKTTLW